MEALLKQVLGQLSAFWQGLTPSRKILLPVAVAIIVSALAFGVATVQRPSYAPLFTKLSPEDAGEIVAKLKEGNIPYKLAEDGTAVLVPQENVYETRISMASQGLPKGGVVGFELFNETKLGTTDFERKLKYNWALQGELTRTIREMSEVEDARVHIVMPERSLFVDEERDSTASVLLKLRPGARLNDGQIYGIANLISGSVEGLKPENVTILDSSGNVLSDVIQSTTGTGISGRGVMAQLQVKRETEKEMEKSVLTMLERIFGLGKVVARVNADLNFDLKEQTAENYSPVLSDTGQGILRSEQTSTEKYQGTGSSGPGGQPGVGSNIPTYQAVDGGGSSQYEKNNATRNYEINKVQEHLVVAPGQVKKLSVAVWVDGSLGQQQLAKVRQAVASAVGFSEERGDQLFIDSMKFENKDFAENTEAKKSLADQWGAILPIAGVVLALLIGGVFVMARRKTKEQAKGQALDVLIAEKHVESMDTPLLETIKEDTERAKLEREVTNYAKEKPEEFAALIRTWLSEDEH